MRISDPLFVAGNLLSSLTRESCTLSTIVPISLRTLCSCYSVAISNSMNISCAYSIEPQPVIQLKSVQ